MILPEISSAVVAVSDNWAPAYLMLSVVVIAFVAIVLSRPRKPESIAARKRLILLCIKLAIITGAGLLWFLRR